MKLTTRGRYAVTAMADLAMHDEGEPVCLNDIAARQGISPAYLEQLFACLKRCGLVRSVRGACGGYRLSRAAGDISVACVMRAVREDLDTTRCGGLRNCRGETACLTHDLWEALNQQIDTFLKGVTLADLCDSTLSADSARASDEAQKVSAGVIRLQQGSA